MLLERNILRSDLYEYDLGPYWYLFLDRAFLLKSDVDVQADRCSYCSHTTLFPLRQKCRLQRRSLVFCSVGHVTLQELALPMRRIPDYMA